MVNIIFFYPSYQRSVYPSLSLMLRHISENDFSAKTGSSRCTPQVFLISCLNSSLFKKSLVLSISLRFSTLFIIKLKKRFSPNNKAFSFAISILFLRIKSLIFIFIGQYSSHWWHEPHKVAR